MAKIRERIASFERSATIGRAMSDSDIGSKPVPCTAVLHRLKSRAYGDGFGHHYDAGSTCHPGEFYRLAALAVRIPTEL